MKNILVVADKLTIIAIIRKVVADFGYNVTTVSNENLWKNLKSINIIL